MLDWQFRLARKTLEITMIGKYLSEPKVMKFMGRQVIQLIRTAQIYFLMKDYNSALHCHYKAVSILDSRDMRFSKIKTYNDIFFMFDMLAEKSNCLIEWFFELLEKSKTIPLTNFLWLSACFKLGKHKNVIKIYSKMKKKKFFTCKAKFIQATILLMLTHKDMNDYCSYSKSYESVWNCMMDLREEDLRSSKGLFQLFQQVYFMLRESFKQKRIEHGKQLVGLIWVVLNRVRRQSEQAYEFLKNQLQAGEQYDIVLLKFDI